MTWVGVGVLFAIFPVAMLVGFTVLSLVKTSRFEWQEPSWDKNPFDFSHGQQFFHLGAFVMLASGAPILARGVELTGTLTPDMSVSIAMGIGTWIGLRALTALSRWQARNGT